MTSSNRLITSSTRDCSIMLFGILACSLWSMARAEDASAPDRGQLVDAVCVSCHAFGPIAGTRDGPAGWRATVYKMIGFGAQVQSTLEINLIVAYLSETYGPSAGVMTTGRLPSDVALRSARSHTSDEIQLPPSAGVDQVRSYCAMCHDLGRIVAVRRSRSSWQRYAKSMLERAGTPASPELTVSITEYLTRHFGAGQD